MLSPILPNIQAQIKGKLVNKVEFWGLNYVQKFDPHYGSTQTLKTLKMGGPP